MYKLVNYFIKYDENLDPTKEFFFSLESPFKNIIAINYEIISNSLVKPYIRDGLLYTQNIALYEKEETDDIFSNGVPYKPVNITETNPEINISLELSNYGVTILYMFHDTLLYKESLTLSEILVGDLNSVIKNKLKNSNLTFEPYQLALLNDKFHEDITNLWLYDTEFYSYMFKEVEFNRSILRIYINRLFNTEYTITEFENIVTLTLPEKSIIFNINHLGNLDIVLKEKTN